MDSGAGDGGGRGDGTRTQRERARQPARRPAPPAESIMLSAIMLNWLFGGDFASYIYY